MARLDPERDCLVVRIVYDGTARSGKTTTLRALGASLSRAMETPAESEGRTLYFDWLDYTGGRFDGRAIRCQVVTVPGQVSLGARRKKLMKDADAVVFVADSSAAGYPASLAALGRTAGELGERRPPVGLVVQANQRDRADAVAIGTVRADCSALSPHLAVTESSATEGLGVRETFVFAVRLALDRVRELQRLGELPETRPEVDDAAGLYATLVEGDPPPSPAEPQAKPEPWVRSRTEAGPEGVGSASQSAPLPPDASVPSGLIWPPVAGRLLLHEAGGEALAPRRRADGSWESRGDSPWWLHSDLAALYFDLEEGRTALVDWAREHAALGSLLSSRRAIALARAAPGAWRLWQLVSPPPTLEAEVREAWSGGVPEAIASGLLTAAKRSLDVQARLAASPLAELATPGNLAVEDGSTVFAGLFPTRRIRPAALDGSGESAGEVLRRHFAPILDELVAAAPWEHNLRVVVEIRRLAAARGWAGIGEILCRLLPPA